MQVTKERLCKTSEPTYVVLEVTADRRGGFLHKRTSNYPEAFSAWMNRAKKHAGAATKGEGLKAMKFGRKRDKDGEALLVSYRFQRMARVDDAGTTEPRDFLLEIQALHNYPEDIEGEEE